MDWRRTRISTAVLLVVQAAGAQPSPDSDDALYAEARAAFDAGRYDTACPLLEQYYERNPAPGALFALAECEAHWPRALRAVVHYEAFLSETATSPSTPVLEQRRSMANEQLQRLSAQVARIRVSTPVEYADGIVKLDGVAIEADSARGEVVEPGEHVVELISPSKTERLVIHVLGGEVRRIDFGRRAERSPAVGTGAAASFPAAQPMHVGPFGAPELLAGGVGALGLLVGSTTGALALGAKSDVDAHCDGPLCDATGLRAADRAQDFATVSTIAFGVALVSLGTAVVFYFTRPRPNAAQRVVSVRF
jgi:hypothetical protein